jgi:hypothetical protein
MFGSLPLWSHRASPLKEEMKYDTAEESQMKQHKLKFIEKVTRRKLCPCSDPERSGADRQGASSAWALLPSHQSRQHPVRVWLPGAHS